MLGLTDYSDETLRTRLNSIWRNVENIEDWSGRECLK